MTRRSTAAVVAGSLLLAGCANARFQTAAGRFGTETASLMDAQSKQIEEVSALEEDRLRWNIAASKTILSLDENCAVTVPDENGKFPVCGLQTPVAGSDSDFAPVEFQYELTHILALQDALADYGENLALLADDAEKDQAAFSASVDKLGASIGKLDAAITTVVTDGKRQRTDAKGKIGTIASVIGALGNLAFKYQRRSALRRIIAANDPLIQEALQELSGADASASSYKRTAALRMANEAATEASFAQSDDERRKKNAEVYRAIDLMNAVEANTPKLERLGAVHAALATLARDNSRNARTDLARTMLADWTRD